jgi:hypothetical protein
MTSVALSNRHKIIWLVNEMKWTLWLTLTCGVERTQESSKRPCEALLPGAMSQQVSWSYPNMQAHMWIVLDYIIMADGMSMCANISAAAYVDLITAAGKLPGTSATDAETANKHKVTTTMPTMTSHILSLTLLILMSFPVPARGRTFL